MNNGWDVIALVKPSIVPFEKYFSISRRSCYQDPSTGYVGSMATLLILLLLHVVLLAEFAAWVL